MQKRYSPKKFFNLILIFSFFINVIYGIPDSGKVTVELNKESYKVILPRSLFNNSQIFIQVTCESSNGPNTDIIVTWSITRSICWDYDFENSQNSQIDEEISQNFFENKTIGYVQSRTVSKCDGHVILEQNLEKSSQHVENMKKSHPKSEVPHPIWIIPKDGVYVFVLEVRNENNKDFNATINIEMLNPTGYLSAADWPLLPFYGVMCLTYVIFGLSWLIVSFLQWRDLLRIQFWIGAVILLGMLEKATFYAEFNSINSTGTNVVGAMLTAEWVSCAKRTLARMLVIIVSLGFGIVKPRLGPMLHRVVFIGVLYLILACVESYLRVFHKNSDQDSNREILIATIPLAVLDSAISWFIFQSLVQTTRTLRLRRNLVKMNLYKHFTNTLIFSVLSSIVFMIYSIHGHKLEACLTDWKNLWLDEAFWHILFSLILLVIMVLWRPTNNNQRYAFTPLLDNPEDGDESDEEQFVSDAYGVKVRFHRSNSPKPKSSTSIEEEIRWVEENIPTSIQDSNLPILDSDDEIMNTKFEVSKMQ